MSSQVLKKILAVIILFRFQIIPTNSSDFYFIALY